LLRRCCHGILVTERVVKELVHFRGLLHNGEGLPEDGIDETPLADVFEHLLILFLGSVNFFKVEQRVVVQIKRAQIAVG